MSSTSTLHKHVAVIGSGFAGLSAAAYLAKAGCEVSVYEKNETIGGRARQFKTDNGYTFDMGPSWYWMPDVFDRFFGDMGYKPSDFYQLQALDPQYAIVFGKDDVFEVPANLEELINLFDQTEKGGAAALRYFLSEAKYKYNIGINKLVYKPGLSVTEFADMDLAKGLLRLQVFTSLSAHVKKHFKNAKLRALMEFPALFLGAMAEDTPALYSLMNYAGLALGTWYPAGGFGSVISAMKTVAERQGVKFYTSAKVKGFDIKDKKISQIHTSVGDDTVDGVIGSADYHHIDQQLLETQYRNYTPAYWQNRVMAPSALIFYLGVKKKIARLKHHNLFFDEELKTHAHEIYREPQWPSKPLFYVCCTSKTDNTVAPAGHENIFILMPLAVGIIDTEELRSRYFDLIIKRLEAYCGESISQDIDYKKSYCIADFQADYNAFGGNAYGLANTLRQTALFKPSIRNKKVENLFFAGHLTVPGPGVPPAIISGNVAAHQLLKYLKS
ncbi:phytoene desaturase family protein [Mucilaginibacter calamicampi]|uniref:Phytoene desaturase family protein n=1 Tax=Mucilaginibacter calamicampi TaxID=1302352 RepID=A0ABW2YRI4_9SPHI